MKIFKKCPLCMGIIVDGQCKDCGYSVPEEEELDQMSGIYDFDPDDYPSYEKTPAGDDIMPRAAQKFGTAAQTAYAEPQERPDINIKVVDPQPNVQNNNGGVYNRSTGSAQGTVRGSFNANTGANTNQNGNPYGSFTPYTPPQGQNGSGKSWDFSRITADMWIKLIVSLFVPIAGIFIGISMLRRKSCREEQILGLICLIRGFIPL